MSRSEIVGRQDEIIRLDTCLEKKEPQLIAVYGRYRTGKTFLINHFFNGRFDFKLTGIHGLPLSIQLKNFMIELSGHTGIDKPVPDNWMDAFALLKKYIDTKSEEDKTVIFFDEMPWMDTPKSGFLQAFEWFWNNYGNSRKNLIFVVCGSATSWMRENIDENKGGLYNRLTCRIYLKQFTLKETREYLKIQNIEWSDYDIVSLYMIMGGIPYYLSLLRSDMTLNQNIDNIFFRKRAELWDEFQFLYRSLFKNSDLYIKIAEILSQKRQGLTREEIADKADISPNGTLTKALTDLEYSGFIRINSIYGMRPKLYQLCDYYSLFYFRFLKDNYGKDEHYWSNSFDNPARRAWAGFTFEQVCMDHLNQIKKKLGISGVLSNASVWHSSDTDNDGAQIDLLIERRDRVINICEIKFSTSEFVIDKAYDINLRNKINAFQRETNTRDTLQLTFITTYGVKKNKYSNIIQNQVTMEDLFD